MSEVRCTVVSDPRSCERNGLECGKFAQDAEPLVAERGTTQVEMLESRQACEVPDAVVR
jgi:hypothetical protein